MKNSIQISPRFFQIEKRNYSDWRKALIREMLQNSADAKGCTKIEIIVEHFEDFSRLTFTDNGAGMSREVLETVYLVMGETTKTGEDSVGGYGKARTLTCFSARNYKIISHDYFVDGCGASYEIFNQEFSKGCTFIIETDKCSWEDIIRSVIRRCSLRQCVYLNGEEIKNSINRGRLVRQLSFGDVYVNKSANPQTLIRVGGCWMFSKYVNDLKAQVIIELHPNTSRDSMTANRDGLQYKLDNELQAFLGELVSESRSALKNKIRHFKKLVNPEATGFRTKLNKKDNLVYNPDNLSQEELHKLTNGDQGTIDFIVNSGANPVDYEHLPVYLKDPLLQSMMLLNESNDPKRIALINNFYHPEKWTTRDGTRYQLIREWFAVCEIVMDELTKLVKSEFNFSVGWVFSDDDEDGCIEACHTEMNGVHYLLINPLNKDNKIRYSVNDKADWNALIALACHEVGHVIHQNHAENFANLMTDLTIGAFRRQKEVFEAVKSAKD